MAGWSRMGRWLNQFEQAVLVCLLVGMIILAFFPILFRNLFSIGLFWIDPLLRHLVLWVALLGASLATREGRHIKIDLVAPHLSPRKRAGFQAALDFFSGLVCLSLVLPAVEFIRMEYAVGKFLIGGLPLWVSQSIMPLMLAVIGIRFLSAGWRSLAPLRQSGSWDSSPPS